MNNTKIAIIGLGYVGLPLAVEFAKKFQVVGFDINEQRIKELRDNEDVTKGKQNTQQNDSCCHDSLLEKCESVYSLIFNSLLLDVNITANIPFAKLFV